MVAEFAAVIDQVNSAACLASCALHGSAQTAAAKATSVSAAAGGHALIGEADQSQLRDLALSLPQARTGPQLFLQQLGWGPRVQRTHCSGPQAGAQQGAHAADVLGQPRPDLPLRHPQGLVALPPGLPPRWQRCPGAARTALFIASHSPLQLAQRPMHAVSGWLLAEMQKPLLAQCT